MLNNEQKERLRQIEIFELAEKERKGKPITRDGKEFIVPSFEKIREDIFALILQNGFSKIERVAPNEANCLIRVFKKHHYAYDYCPNVMINLYGAICFVVKDDNWICSDEKYVIDYSEHKVRYWLCIDDSNAISTDFFDIYTKVSP